MKQLTKKRLKTMRPCSDGFEYWVKNCESLPTDKQLLKLVKRRGNWANWLIVRLMNRKQKLTYAIYAAEQVLSIFEKKHPDDKRPRKAIEAAKAVLKRDSKKNRDAADADAAYAAYATYAADAAYAAAAAAYAADADATYAAAAAAAYAYAAAADAAKAKLQLKIIKYGIKLLEN